MSDSHIAHYHCPLCQQPLTANAQGFSCAQRHQFDRAKEGYVNLLPVQNKGSKVPGDSPQMVSARRDFLAAGFYDCLQQAVAKALSQQLNQPSIIIDAGCGEGYYTNALAQQLSQHQFYGIDIAKSAIKYASKRARNAHFAVASNINLPFADNFADLICKIFAPVAHQEVLRVLKPSARLLSVVPGPKHLLELKQRIYDNAKYHDDETCPHGFELLDTQQLSQSVCLDSTKHIADLAQMTPFAWKMNPQKKQNLIDSSPFNITFDFVINVYQQA